MAKAKKKEDIQENGLVIKHQGENKGIATLPTQERIRRVAKMISKGKTRESCIEFLMDTYNLTRTTSQTYYYEAFKFLAPTEEEKKMLVEKNIVRLEQLYEEAHEARNFKVCREIIAELNKIAGVGGTKINIGQSDAEGNKQVIQISFD